MSGLQLRRQHVVAKIVRKRIALLTQRIEFLAALGNQFVFVMVLLIGHQLFPGIS